MINPGSVAQTVQLPGVYRKLTGSQAPLFQARLDDNDLLVNGSWVKSAASFAQFGSTVYTTTAPNPLATITYQPNLLYAGTYQVLAWVVPTATQSSAVDITIYHAAGKTTVKLDETQGEIGWRDLGTYRFGAGTTGRALLSATGAGLVVADAFKWVSTARYNDGQRGEPDRSATTGCHHSTKDPRYFPAPAAALMRRPRYTIRFLPHTAYSGSNCGPGDRS